MDQSLRCILNKPNGAVGIDRDGGFMVMWASAGMRGAGGVCRWAIPQPHQLPACLPHPHTHTYTHINEPISLSSLKFSYISPARFLDFFLQEDWIIRFHILD